MHTRADDQLPRPAEDEHEQARQAAMLAIVQIPVRSMDLQSGSFFSQNGKSCGGFTFRWVEAILLGYQNEHGLSEARREAM